VEDISSHVTSDVTEAVELSLKTRLAAHSDAVDTRLRRLERHLAALTSALTLSSHSRHAPFDAGLSELVLGNGCGDTAGNGVDGLGAAGTECLLSSVGEGCLLSSS
jgi:hypothetical protein